MLANSWLPPWSLRGRLSATALAGLTTSVVLTVLLFLTASSASEVVSTAQRTHEQVRVYSQLQDAARDYQDNSYTNVNEPGPAARQAVVEARNRLENLLTEAQRLPVADERERNVSARIVRQGQAVVEHFRDPEALIARVDRVDYIY